jgi:hypothetical protein
MSSTSFVEALEGRQFMSVTLLAPQVAAPLQAAAFAVNGYPSIKGNYTGSYYGYDSGRVRIYIYSQTSSRFTGRVYADGKTIPVSGWMSSSGTNRSFKFQGRTGNFYLRCSGTFYSAQRKLSGGWSVNDNGDYDYGSFTVRR